MPTGVYFRTKEHRAIKSKAMLGNKNSLGFKLSEETKEKIRKYQKGRKKSIATRIKMSERQRGEKAVNWKGGKDTINSVIRSGIEFTLWREAVFKRDDYTCQKYKIRGGRLHPHHILNFAQYPELRFVVDNGITLSEKAHKEFHKKYGQLNNTKEQLQEFLSVDNST